jgi:hypothetical protein
MEKEASQKTKEINRYIAWTITRLKYFTEMDPLKQKGFSFTSELAKTAKQMSTKKGLEQTIKYCNQIKDQYFKEARIKRIADLYTQGAIDSIIKLLEIKKEKAPQDKVQITIASEKDEAGVKIANSVHMMLKRRNKTMVIRYQIYELFEHDMAALKKEIESISKNEVEKIEINQSMERCIYPKHAYYGKIQYITKAAMPIVVVRFTGEYIINR